MKHEDSNNTNTQDSSREIGLRLAEIRKSKKLSQSEVASAIGVTQGSLSQLESGLRLWSCPAIIKLIKYYKVPYEEVFGKISEDITKPKVSHNSPLDQPVQLLKNLADAVHSKQISLSVRAYMNISIYKMLRKLYECNPRNSSAIFNLDSTQADKLTTKFLTEEPQIISSYIKASSRINKQSIELPVEMSAKLREFIGQCENFLAIFDNDEYRK